MGIGKVFRRCCSHSGSSDEEDDAPLSISSPKITRQKVGAVVPPKPTKNSTPAGGSKKKKDPRLVGDPQLTKADPPIPRKGVTNKITDKKDSAGRSTEKNPPLVGVSAVQEPQAHPQLTNETAKSSSKRDSKSADKKDDTVVPPEPMEKSSAGRSRDKTPPIVGVSAVQEPQADPPLTNETAKSSRKGDSKSADKKDDTVVPPMKNHISAGGRKKKGPCLVGDSAFQEPQADPPVTKETAKSTRKRDSKYADKKDDTIVPLEPMKNHISAGGSKKKGPCLVGDSTFQEPQADPPVTKETAKSTRKRDSKSADKKDDTVVPLEPMEKSSAARSREKTPPLVDVSVLQDPSPEVSEESQKACKVDSSSSDTDTWSVAESEELMEKICSNIKASVEGLDKSVIDEFNANLPSFDPSPDKYGVPGVTLKASDITNESQRDFFVYAKQDLQTLQGLASAAELDKPMFAEKIDKVLTRWTKLFSAQFSEGMEKMAEALKELRELLVDDSTPLLPFDASVVAAQKTQVEEALRKVAAIKEAIPAALAKIEDVEIAAKIKCEALAACMKHQEEEIANLKASLELAEANLKETRGHHAETNEFFKKSEAARQDLHKVSEDVKETVDRSGLAETEIHKCMEYTGGDSATSQPKTVHSLLAFMQSSSCEEYPDSL